MDITIGIENINSSDAITLMDELSAELNILQEIAVEVVLTTPISIIQGQYL